MIKKVILESSNKIAEVHVICDSPEEESQYMVKMMTSILFLGSFLIQDVNGGTGYFKVINLNNSPDLFEIVNNTILETELYPIRSTNNGIRKYIVYGKQQKEDRKKTVLFLSTSYFNTLKH